MTCQSDPELREQRPGRPTVRAIVVEQHGGPEVLKVKDVVLERPGSGQALVRLAVAGVNFVDIYQRRGIDPRPLPFTPGLEGAGLVEEVGEGVTNVKLGDRVAYARKPGA